MLLSTIYIYIYIDVDVIIYFIHIGVHSNVFLKDIVIIYESAIQEGCHPYVIMHL